MWAEHRWEQNGRSRAQRPGWAQLEVKCMGLFRVGTQRLLCGLNPRPVPSPTPRPSQAFPALGHLLGDPLMTDLQVKGLRNRQRWLL